MTPKEWHSRQRQCRPLLLSPVFDQPLPYLSTFSFSSFFSRDHVLIATASMPASLIPEEQYPKLQIIRMKSGGKVKERTGRDKANSFFVCFRPPCAHPLGGEDDSFDYESKSSRMVKPRSARNGKESIDVGDGRGSRPVGGGDGGDKEKDMEVEPWSKGRPVLAYIALHPSGHNYVIQTPAEILATPTRRRKMVHAAFAKVFNAMTSSRNSTQSTKNVNPRVRDKSVPHRSKTEPRAPPSSSLNSSAMTDNSSIASSSRRSSSTRSITSWSDSAGDQQSEPNASETRASKPKRYCRYDYLSCVSLPSLALCLLMLSSLSMLMVLGKLCAIIWTTSWLYMVTPRRSDSHHEHINESRRPTAVTVGKEDRVIRGDSLQMQRWLERSRSRA